MARYDVWSGTRGASYHAFGEALEAYKTALDRREPLAAWRLTGEGYDCDDGVECCSGLTEDEEELVEALS